mmetsp:Transcript_38230/g.83926  ORF Transcript_38230/g.83926 Transcript_38230/m.83926 type:complete len:88 (+) Transcript_38230:542-805(+)
MNMGDLTLSETHEDVMMAVLSEIDVERYHMTIPWIYETALELIVKRWNSFCGAAGWEKAVDHFDELCDILLEDVKEVVASTLRKLSL